MIAIGFCRGWNSCIFVRGFFIRLVKTSLCCIIDYAICVSYCGIVCGCGLVLIMASWKVRMLWSSRYAPHVVFLIILLVIMLPFKLCDYEFPGRS
jgi:hypothetical protein